MRDLTTSLKDLKKPKNAVLSALVCLFCMSLGYARGSIGGLIFGMVMGIVFIFFGVFLIHKHREREKEMWESLVIPKIGMTEKREQWLRKKKLREVKSENRIDLVIKIVWWIIFAIIGLNLLYWISPLIYYALQTAKR